jgi:uncharacterized protein YozE (UPF0346 family)
MITVRNKKDKQVNMRLSQEQYDEIIKRMQMYNFTCVSEYLRFVGTNAQFKVEA